jgi:cytochrome c
VSPWRISVTVLVLAGAGAGVLTWQAEQHRGKLEDRAAMLTGGSPRHGRALFSAYGCNACHALRGAVQADSLVGPALDGIGTRAIIAGKLPNRPENMIRWIATPQQVAPGSAMPNLGVSQQEAADIAAYLYASGA